MEERRRNKRMELESRLMIKPLNGDTPTEVTIEICDVSKTGVGFICNEALSIGTVYEAFLTIWTKEVLHAFLEIIRIEKTGDAFTYGATFVGMPEMEASRIGIYDTVQTVLKDKEQQ